MAVPERHLAFPTWAWEMGAREILLEEEKVQEVRGAGEGMNPRETMGDTLDGDTLRPPPWVVRGRTLSEG